MGSASLSASCSPSASRVSWGCAVRDPPADPATFALMTILFAGVGLLASTLPARCAAGIDFAVALQSD